MTTRAWVAVLAALAPLGSACAAVTPDGTPPMSATHGHYVVLGTDGHGDTVGLARVILDPGFLCPSITGDGPPRAMIPRRNPRGFPVIVCEAVLGIGGGLAIELADGTLALPPVPAAPERLALFGDSGCKLRAPGKTKGCAPGELAAPFSSLAAAASADPPEVILHVGDYNYRGTPGGVYFTQAASSPSSPPRQVKEWTYDAGDGSTAAQACEQDTQAGFYSQSAPNSGMPDTWEAWQEDFFAAAGPLLAAAPWIVARGNHELCSRAGPGWFYFLDPGTNLLPGRPQLSCPPPDPSRGPMANVVLSEPYAVRLGTLSVVVLDSANACDAFTNTQFLDVYRRQLATASQLAVAAGSAWLMSHRPVWGVDGFDPGTSAPCVPGASAKSGERLGCINVTLQQAVRSLPGGALPGAVKLVLAGHMHRFQALTFPGSSRPPMIVVGNSGVELEKSGPQGRLSDVPVDGVRANVVTTRDKVEVGSKKQKFDAFGYLSITLGGEGAWTGTMTNPSEGIEIAECAWPPAEASGSGVCRLAKGVKAK